MYKMLDFCEDQTTCRRKLWLGYLGEEFNPDLCRKMCDNCRKQNKEKEHDFTEAAVTIIKFIKDNESMTMH